MCCRNTKKASLNADNRYHLAHREHRRTDPHCRLDDRQISAG